MRPSRCACDPPRDYAVSHSSGEITGGRDETGGRLREAAVASVARLNPSVRCMSPDTACRSAPEESAELTLDAIGAFHRAWDERRMQFRSLARAGQLAKGAGA